MKTPGEQFQCKRLANLEVHVERQRLVERVSEELKRLNWNVPGLSEAVQSYVQRGRQPERHSLGARVRAAREAAVMKRLDVANAAGVNSNELAAIEEDNGQGADPTIRTLRAIAKALGVRVGELVDD